MPAWAVDEVIEHWPERCRCGHVFSAGEQVPVGEPACHQVEELPPIMVRVTEHRRQRLRCPECSRRTRAALPDEVACSSFGPRLQAAVATLSVRNRVSPKDTVELIEELLVLASARARWTRSSGHATDNRIDVLWEFKPASRRVVRLLFECRSYRRRINQQALQSWRSVVDDVAKPGIETIGVMVTTTGYQSGAQRVADSYGIVIFELRAPTASDRANRWRSVRIAFVARLPLITDFGRHGD